MHPPPPKRLETPLLLCANRGPVPDPGQDPNPNASASLSALITPITVLGAHGDGSFSLSFCFIFKDGLFSVKAHVDSQGMITLSDEQLLVETQLFEGQQGRYLLTPLRIDGTDTVLLVNRGWIPSTETDFDAFNTAESVSLTGRLQRSQTLNRNRESEITADRRIYRIDVDAAAAVMPYPVMSMYLLPEGSGETAPNQLPRLVAADLTIDEGSHLSYAIQWFTFALMLGVIYIVLVYRQTGERKLDASAQQKISG